MKTMSERKRGEEFHGQYERNVNCRQNGEGNAGCWFISAIMMMNKGLKLVNPRFTALTKMFVVQIQFNVPEPQFVISIIILCVRDFFVRFKGTSVNRML